MLAFVVPMPTLAICIDCGRTVDAVTRGRCGACLPAARAEQNAKYGDRTGRMTAARREHQAFKDSPAWRKLRRKIILRDGMRCQDCGTSERLTVHHIVKVRTAPDIALDPDNLITLCRSCHGRHEMRVAS